MDKLVTAVIVVVVVGFFVWLYQSPSGDMMHAQSQEGMWVATVDGQAMGSFTSYHDCVVGMKSRINVETTVYSCSSPG